MRAESSFSSAFSFPAEGNLVSPSFLISLATVSNKVISPKVTQESFLFIYLSLTPCSDSRRVSAFGGCRPAFPGGHGSDFPFRILQAFSCANGGSENGVAPFRQFLITADTVFEKKVHGSSRPFLILSGRSPLVSCTLLDFDFVSNINEHADLPVALSELAGGAGASGDARVNGLFRVISS